MLRVFAVILLVLGTGCADRTMTTLVPEALEIGTVYPVFVATSRARDDRGVFGKDRSRTLNFTELKVSVPPEHEAGKIRAASTRPDPQRQFTIAAEDDFDGENDFINALSKRIKSQPKGNREVTIYVHGYNNSFSDGAFRITQLMHDIELPGTAVHYSWPSAANPLGYTHDRDSMLFARDGLEKLLRDVQKAGPTSIILIGHSMGTLLVMEALRQIEIGTPGWSENRLSGVILISPDIDLDLFRTQADRIADLPQPFAIFVSERDRALRLSARLNGSSKRLGNLEDPDELAEYPVTIVDVSEFANSADGHFTFGTSPTLIALLKGAVDLEKAFQSDRAGMAGLLPGTALNVRNATQLILSPALALALPNTQ